jgi:hypothetical protein
VITGISCLGMIISSLEDPISLATTMREVGMDSFPPSRLGISESGYQLSYDSLAV